MEKISFDIALDRLKDWDFLLSLLVDGWFDLKN
jgi:hypothetical protein